MNKLGYHVKSLIFNLNTDNPNQIVKETSIQCITTTNCLFCDEVKIIMYVCSFTLIVVFPCGQGFSIQNILIQVINHIIMSVAKENDKF